MARNQRTKLTFKDIGEPALIKAQPETVKSLPLGVLLGIAEKIVERQSPDKTETFEGLGGQFRVVPTDKTKDELEAGVLFIPEAFFNQIAGTLRAAQKTDPNATVSFAYEVSAIRANNPAGYSWDCKPMIESATASPLDLLIDQNRASLDKSAAFKALPAPDKVSAKK